MYVRNDNVFKEAQVGRIRCLLKNIAFLVFRKELCLFKAEQWLKIDIYVDGLSINLSFGEKDPC